MAPRPPAAMERTRAEVDATLQTAKLDAAELLPAAHCLRFGPAAAGDVCLLELEPALCGRLQAGHRWGATGAVQRGPGDGGRAERSPLCAGGCGRGVQRGARAPPRPGPAGRPAHPAGGPAALTSQPRGRARVRKRLRGSRGVFPDRAPRPSAGVLP